MKPTKEDILNEGFIYQGTLKKMRNPPIFVADRFIGFGLVFETDYKDFTLINDNFRTVSWEDILKLKIKN